MNRSLYIFFSREFACTSHVEFATRLWSESFSTATTLAAYMEGYADRAYRVTGCFIATDSPEKFVNSLIDRGHVQVRKIN